MSVRQEQVLIEAIGLRKSKQSFVGRLLPLLLFVAFIASAAGLSIVSYRLLINRDNGLMLSIGRSISPYTTSIKQYTRQIIQLADQPKVLVTAGVGCAILAGIFMRSSRRQWR